MSSNKRKFIDDEAEDDHEDYSEEEDKEDHLDCVELDSAPYVEDEQSPGWYRQLDSYLDDEDGWLSGEYKVGYFEGRWLIMEVDKWEDGLLLTEVKDPEGSAKNPIDLTKD